MDEEQKKKEVSAPRSRLAGRSSGTTTRMSGPKPKKTNKTCREKGMKTNVLPSTFVWTKIKDESGQPIPLILNRKELERQTGNTFWWGIGESKETQVRHLVARGEHQEVIFSEMPSRAHLRDSEPEGVLLWEKYVTS